MKFSFTEYFKTYMYLIFAPTPLLSLYFRVGPMLLYTLSWHSHIPKRRYNPRVLKCRQLQTVIDDVNSYRSKVITLKQQVHYLNTVFLRWNCFLLICLFPRFYLDRCCAQCSASWLIQFSNHFYTYRFPFTFSHH